jgi:putative tricarboxylic transport membrane protein
MVKSDFVAGLAFVALGVAALVESLRMPRFEHLGVNPYSVPGVVPGGLGLVIMLLGAVLVVRAGRAGGWRLGPELARLATLRRNDAAHRFTLALVLTFGYAAGLIGAVPFWLATGLFVFAFITLFEWSAGADRAARLKALGIAGIEAVLVAAVVTLVFRDLFLVTLP